MFETVDVLKLVVLTDFESLESERLFVVLGDLAFLLDLRVFQLALYLLEFVVVFLLQPVDVFFDLVFEFLAGAFVLGLDFG